MLATQANKIWFECVGCGLGEVVIFLPVSQPLTQDEQGL